MKQDPRESSDVSLFYMSLVFVNVNVNIKFI